MCILCIINVSYRAAQNTKIFEFDKTYFSRKMDKVKKEMKR